MKNLRKYGKAPFNVAVIHGGPGVPGEMAPVARQLSTGWGILEPLQTAISLKGQVQELRSVLEENGSLPMILVGHSWGAWLIFILTAQCPSLAKKLILVGSGPFEEKYASRLMETRLSRLNEEEKKEVFSLMEILNSPETDNESTAMTKLGKLMNKTDTYASLPHNGETLNCQQEVFQKVWPEANELRKSGKLLQLGKQIICPVVAIHGDYDPHPPEGVKDPLSRILKNFRLVTLKNCGHEPWIEPYAKDKFYKVLKEELG
ncbi:alpha/beta hydrolase [Candidatus Aerophobetes bacterium Ae_b3a]|nr:MAG: alpha/beta hydrolase [Candidatus Aerophobetes bacterium Ae_b3a]